MLDTFYVVESSYIWDVFYCAEMPIIATKINHAKNAKRLAS